MSINIEELRSALVEETESQETLLLTEEEVEAEEALEHVEANDEADPTPLINNLTLANDSDWADSNGVAWRSAGNTITSDNGDINLTPGAVYGVQFDISLRGTGGVLSDDVTITPVEEEHPIAATREELIAEHDKFDKQRLAKAVEAEKKLKDAVKKQNRSRLLHYTSYVLQPNDLMLLLAGDGNIEMIKSDFQRIGTVSSLYNSHTKGNGIQGSHIGLLNSGLMFDKNMNPLTANGSPFKEKSMKGIPRIDIGQNNLGTYINPATKKRWIIVDKEAFIKSSGKKFKIKHRVGFSILQALKMKRKILDQIKEAKVFVDQLKETVGGIYDEENYEIVYELKFGMHNQNSYFHIYLQFPNLIVSNSIELYHSIENMVTRMDGIHFKDKEGKKDAFRIERKLKGMRTKFSPEDAYYGYNHSHLSSGSVGWNSFCMGDDHFMANISSVLSNTSFIELEMALIGVLDHISWESLEGGPYIKMEDIGGIEGIIITNESLQRELKVHTRSVIRRMFALIKQKDLTLLKKAYRLNMQSNKEVTYVLDKRVFIEQFIGLFTSKEIDRFNRENDINNYVYIPIEDHFVSTNTRGHRAKDWNTLVKNARAKVSRFPITYMNGKYIRPQVIVGEIPDGALMKREIASFHPKILFYIANIIHYHLLNELKNVK